MSMMLTWPYYGHHLPEWLRDAEEFAFVKTFLERAPERLHALPLPPKFPPVWSPDYVDENLFLSLRIANDRADKAWSEWEELKKEWGRYRDILAAAERGSAIEDAHTTVGRGQMSVEHIRAECARLERLCEECLRTANQAFWYAKEVLWLCRAEAELECARREAAEADSADLERAKEWVALCERYLQIITKAWREECDRREWEGRRRFMARAANKLETGSGL